MIVESNPELTALSLPALESFGGRVLVNDNGALTRIDLGIAAGLSELTVTANGALPSLAGLEHITSLWGSLAIAQNASLRDLDGLAALRHVDGSLWISGNSDLDPLELPNLVAIGGDLELGSHAVLEHVSLPNLEAVGGNVWIGEGGTFRPTIDPLAEVDLPLLTTVYGHLSLVGNDHLPKLAFPRLTSVGALEIVQNPRFESLAGLGALTTVGGGVVVEDNPVLPQCEVCALIDQLVGFAGSVESSGNQPDTCTDTCV